MKNKTLPYLFLTISPIICQIKIFILKFFLILRTFVVQAIALQAKLPGQYVFQNHTLLL